MPQTASEATSGTNGEDYAGLIAGMLGEARDEISRADTKASILLALYGALQVVFLTALASGGWNPTQLGNLPAWAFWLGWLLTVAGVIVLSISVYPRTANRRDECITYFGHVAACQTIGDMREGLAKAATGCVSRNEEQLWAISRIAHKKYLHIRQSMWLTAAGMVLCAGAVVFGKCI